MTDRDADKFRKEITAIFGDGAQSRFARFLRLAGDHRPYNTVLRAINSYATGRYPVPGELRALLTAIGTPDEIAELIRQAKREPEPPRFALRPLPSAQKRKR